MARLVKHQEMLTSFDKTDRNVMTVIGDKHSISERQPISNQAEEIFSNKTQKTVIPIINQRKKNEFKDLEKQQ